MVERGCGVDERQYNDNLFLIELFQLPRFKASGSEGWGGGGRTGAGENSNTYLGKK